MITGRSDRHPYRGHARHLPMSRNVEFASHSLTIEGSELMHLQAQRVRLKRHVGNRLPQVVVSELRILHRGALHKAMGKVRDQHACARCPPARTPREMADQAAMNHVAPSAHHKGPRLRIPR